MTECKNECINERMSIEASKATFYWKQIVPSTCHSLLQIRHSLHFLQGCVRELDKVPEALTWPSDSLFSMQRSIGGILWNCSKDRTPHRKQQLQNSLVSVGGITNMRSLMSSSGHKWRACTNTSDCSLQEASLLSSWSMVHHTSGA